MHTKKNESWGQVDNLFPCCVDMHSDRSDDVSIARWMMNFETQRVWLNQNSGCVLMRTVKQPSCNCLPLSRLRSKHEERAHLILFRANFNNSFRCSRISISRHVWNKATWGWWRKLIEIIVEEIGRSSKMALGCIHVEVLLQLLIFVFNLILKIFQCIIITFSNRSLLICRQWALINRCIFLMMWCRTKCEIFLCIWRGSYTRGSQPASHDPFGATKQLRRSRSRLWLYSRLANACEC